MITTQRRRRGTALTAALSIAALVLAGCSSSSDSDADAPSGSAPGYPVTVESDLGEITLTEKPEKILVLGTTRHVDALAALGEPPAIFSTGFNDEKETLEYYPWIEGKYGEYATGLSGEFENGVYELDAEAIGAIDPDLIILQTFGSLPDALRDKLSQIAPLYAEDDPKTWTKAVTDMGALTGKSEQAKEIIAAGEAEFAAARERIAKLQGKSFLAGFVNPDGSFGPYPEMGTFVSELGLEPAANMPVLPDRGDPISVENRDQISADVVFVGSSDGDYKKLESDPRFADLPAVKNGTMLLLEPMQVSPDAMTPIGPASIPWLINKIGPVLEKSTLNVGQ